MLMEVRPPTLNVGQSTCWGRRPNTKGENGLPLLHGYGFHTLLPPCHLHDDGQDGQDLLKVWATANTPSYAALIRFCLLGEWEARYLVIAKSTLSHEALFPRTPHLCWEPVSAQASPLTGLSYSSPTGSAAACPDSVLRSA